MATPSWRVGAFAERFPQEARDLGRLYALEANANEMLYAAAGVVRPGAIVDASYGASCAPYPCDGGPPGCCAASSCGTQGIDTCCSRGTCSSEAEAGEDAVEFDDLYPEADQALDAAHARAAAVRDILADGDVADVAAAVQEAMGLSDAKLVQMYAPQVPAKPLPSGEAAPARCPICGAQVCPTCGCSCECCDVTYEKPEPAAA